MSMFSWMEFCNRCVRQNLNKYLYSYCRDCLSSKEAKINILSWALKAIFSFTKPFLIQGIEYACQTNICNRNSLSFIKHSFFLIPPPTPPFQKVGLKFVPLNIKERRWYCGFSNQILVWPKFFKKGIFYN